MIVQLGPCPHCGYLLEAEESPLRLAGDGWPTGYDHQRLAELEAEQRRGTERR